MKTRITKKALAELKQILDDNGYWSEQTWQFMEQYDNYSRTKLHQKAQTYCKYGYGL